VVAQVFPQTLARVSHLAEEEMAVVFEQGHMLQKQAKLPLANFRE